MSLTPNELTNENRDLAEQIWLECQAQRKPFTDQESKLQAEQTRKAELETPLAEPDLGDEKAWERFFARDGARNYRLDRTRQRIEQLRNEVHQAGYDFTCWTRENSRRFIPVLQSLADARQNLRRARLQAAYEGESPAMTEQRLKAHAETVKEHDLLVHIGRSGLTPEGFATLAHLLLDGGDPFSLQLAAPVNTSLSDLVVTIARQAA